MVDFFRPVKQGLALFTLACAIVLLGFAIYSTRWIAFSLLIGLGFGIILTPVIQKTSNRWHIPKALSVLIVVFGTFGTLAGFGYLSFRLISEQYTALASRWPDFVHRIDGVADHYPWVRNFYQSERIQGAISDTAQAVLHTLASSFSWLGGFFFIFATAIYLAVNPAEYFNGMLSAVPRSSRQRVAEVSTECAGVLRKWVLAQLTAMVIVGAMVAIGLKIVGSQYWFILSVLTSALELISFLGPLIAFLAATVVTLASQPEKVLWVMGLYLVILRLEGDLIVPLVMKGRIKLSPIPLLTLMLMLGTWFGVLGLFAAAPILAVLRTIYVRVYVPKMDAAKPVNPEMKPEHESVPWPRRLSGP